MNMNISSKQLDAIVKLARDNEKLDIGLLKEAMGLTEEMELTVKEEPRRVEFKAHDSQKAYGDTLDWITANLSKFTGEGPEVFGEIVGGRVFIIRSAFNEFMEESGYANRVILAEWAKSDLIKPYYERSTGKVRYDQVRSIGNMRYRCVLLKLPPNASALVGLEQVSFDVETSPTNNRKPWAKYEEDLLKEELVKYGEPRKVPWKVIGTLAELTGRTEKAIKTRLYSLVAEKTDCNKSKELIGKRSWKPGDDKELIRLYKKGKLSTREIAKKLGRTEGAINHRKSHLQLGSTSKEWTTDEENRLIGLYEDTTLPMRAIGRRLGRTVAAVETRVNILRNEGRINTYRVEPTGGTI